MTPTLNFSLIIIPRFTFSECLLNNNSWIMAEIQVFDEFFRYFPTNANIKHQLWLPLKSMSATHIGSSKSLTSHLTEFIFEASTFHSKHSNCSSQKNPHVRTHCKIFLQPFYAIEQKQTLHKNSVIRNLSVPCIGIESSWLQVKHHFESALQKFIILIQSKHFKLYQKQLYILQYTFCLN